MNPKSPVAGERAEAPTSARSGKAAEHRYEFWGNQGSHIPLWQRIVFFPLMVVGFWGVALLSVLWLGPGVLREAPIVWWRMIRYGEGQAR